MRTTSFAIALVLGSSACVLTIGFDDEVGETPEEEGTSEESSTTNGTESESESTTTQSETTESETTESETATTETETTETETTEEETETTETETDTGVVPGDCDGVGTSDLPGVCIWFPTPGDVWALEQAAQGIAIPYHVIVEADVADVVPLTQDAGGCGQPNASGLIVFEHLTGGDESYCLCDEGLCPGPPNIPVIIDAGNTPFEFEWTGVNWFGPSDFNNPYGPPFPAGDYTLEVSAVGTVGGMPFTVSNTFTVTLIEVP